jgi:hypothetical protein
MSIEKNGIQIFKVSFFDKIFQTNSINNMIHTLISCIFIKDKETKCQYQLGIIRDIKWEWNKKKLSLDKIW